MHNYIHLYINIDLEGDFMQINLNISEYDWGLFCQYCAPLKISPEDIIALYVRNLSSSSSQVINFEDIDEESEEFRLLPQQMLKSEDEYDRFWRICSRYKIRQNDIANILHSSQGAISRWQNKVGSSADLLNIIYSTNKNLDHFFYQCFHTKYKNILDEKVDHTVTSFFTQQFNFKSKFNEEEMYYIVWDCFGYLISINKIKDIKTHFERVANSPELFLDVANKTDIEDIIHNCIIAIVAAYNKK